MLNRRHIAVCASGLVSAASFAACRNRTEQPTDIAVPVEIEGGRAFADAFADADEPEATARAPAPAICIDAGAADPEAGTSECVYDESILDGSTRCAAARAAVFCTLAGGVREECTSDDPTRCRGQDPSTCQNHCCPDEYAASCPEALQGCRLVAGFGPVPPGGTPTETFCCPCK